MTDKQLLSNAAKTNMMEITAEQLADLKAITDDEMLRAAGSLDMFAGVLSTLRLRDALHKEEIAIKRLTRWLVGLTWVLVGLTGVLIYLGFKALSHP